MTLIIKGKNVILNGGGGDFQAALKSKLLAYWPMNGTAARSGHLISSQTDLSPKNSPTSFTGGILENYYQFNNSASQALQNSSLSLHIFKKWALAFWSYTLPNYQFGYGVSKHNSSSFAVSQFLTLIVPGQTNIQFFVASGNNGYSALASNALLINQWQLNVCQFSQPDNKISISIDGTERGNTVLPSNLLLNQSQEPFAIGGYQTSTNFPIQHYNGRIGMCAIFIDNLTDEEIAWLWNNGSGNAIN